jgi:glucokinase
MATAPPVTSRIILAGDIGGTKTNLALYSLGKSGKLEMLRNKRFPSAEFDSLNAIVAKFLHKNDAPIDAACFGVPGPVRDKRSQPTNLRWPADGYSLINDLKTTNVSLLNDLAANAYGISALAESEFETIQPGFVAAEGNRCVVSPGTGLGEGGLFWDGKQHRVWACEGGHSDFAPRSAIEVQLLAYLQARFGHVSVERVVSGLGFGNIYEFLRDTGTIPELPEVSAAMKINLPAKVIVAFAETAKCQLCVQALDIFCECLAHEAANFALKAMATGGVYLGGGIPSKILWKLRTPAFRAAFNAKGRMEALMETMPVKVILNDNAALIGAAKFAADALG